MNYMLGFFIYLITTFLRENANDINTFDIAAEVLDLHRRKLVQTVMLSETAHKSMDNPKIAPFLSLDMTFGDLVGFIKEYGQYFSPKNDSTRSRVGFLRPVGLSAGVSPRKGVTSRPEYCMIRK